MTLLFEGFNWIAIIVATLAYFALGALWYSKALFANRWLTYTNIDPKDPEATKGVAQIMLTSFVWMFITCVALAILRSRLDLEVWQSGAKLGLLTGFCFGMASISISYLYERRPAGLHLINGGYTVIGNIIAAIIICSWT